MNLKNSNGEESLFDSASRYDVHECKLLPDVSVGTGGVVVARTFEWERRSVSNNGGSGEGGAQQIHGCSCPSRYCQKCACEISSSFHTIQTESEGIWIFSRLVTWLNIKHAIILAILLIVVNKLFYLLPISWIYAQPEPPFYTKWITAVSNAITEMYYSDY